MASFFCTDCFRLLRNEDDIVQHMNVSKHNNFLVSLSDMHDLRCMKCAREFQSRTECDGHTVQEDLKDHIIFRKELPEPVELEPFATPTAVRLALKSAKAPVKNLEQRTRKDTISSLPYRNDGDDDDEEDEENILISDVVQSAPEKSDASSVAKPPGDTSSEDDNITNTKLHGQKLFLRRNLKNLGFSVDKREEIRSRFVLAEGCSGKKALERVKWALQNYAKHEFFIQHSKGNKGKRDAGGTDAYEYCNELEQVCLKNARVYKTCPAKGKRMLAVAQAAKYFLENENHKGIRENSLHYMYPEEFDEPGLKEEQMQRRISEAVAALSESLKISRECLKIRPAAKGLIRGQVKLYIDNELLVDCRFGGESGTQIPSEIESVNRIEIPENVKHVLVLEKDSIFYDLAAKMFHETDETILVTGKGFPDVATRMLLRKLRVSYPALKFFGLVDCNPSGASIYLTYNIGSEERAYDMCLTVSDIVLLEFCLDDVKVTDCKKLSKKDWKLLHNLMGSRHIDYSASKVGLMENLTLMGEKGLKADLDTLMKEDNLLQFVRDKIQKAKEEESASNT